MQKTVLVLYTPLKDSTLSFVDKKYQRAYERLYSIAAEAGLTLYRAPFEWYDVKKNIFTQAWRYADGEWALFPDIQPDGIYDKTLANETSERQRTILKKHYPLLNDPEFTRVAGNKYLTSLLVPEFFKPYALIATRSDLEVWLEKFSGRLLVLKPALGSGGKGVFIGSPEEAKETSLTFPLLAQEFIDGRSGITGITTGLHDLRVVYIGETPIYSYIRTPAEGKLLANVAQGGSMSIIPLKDLPASIAVVATAVHRAFSAFPKKVYTIDFIFDSNQTPWIVELNTMPGIYFEAGQEEARDDFYRKLVETMKALQAKGSQACS